jgi:hypothetical protein
VAADPHAVTRQVLTTIILTTIIPALAFSWSSPLAWAAEVQQAHLVKKLKLQHAADIALAKTAYFRAVDRLRVGLVNLTAAERAEVVGIIAGLQRAQNDTLTAIAGTFKTIAGAELAVPTIDDATIVRRYDELAGMLESRVLDVVDDPRELTSPPTPFDPPSNVPANANPAAGSHMLPPAGATLPERSANVSTAAQSQTPAATGITLRWPTVAHTTLN